MRDFLTALAGAVIVMLLAALAVPPLVDWTAYRGLVDRAVGRSLGLPARSEGRLEVRLLPSPRLRLDRLRAGEGAKGASPGASSGASAGGPALDLRFVKAEMALAPLLKGEVRFTETRVGRAEIRLAGSGSDALSPPPGLVEALRGRDVAVEDLSVQQLLLTLVQPATGRIDQFGAEGLHLQAPALAGPWRIEGSAAGTPFRLATGEVGADGAVTVKLSAGGDDLPRFEADARIDLAPPGRRGVEAEGSARLVVGPPTQAAGAYLPFSLAGRFTAQGPALRFEGVEAQVDPAGQALRLNGSGRLDLRAARAGLTLDARRLDLDAFLTSAAGQAMIARGVPRAALPLTLDLDVAVEGAMLGAAEWSALAFAGTLEPDGGIEVRRAAATGPGAAAISASGRVETGPNPRFTGPVSLSAPAADAVLRALRRLGLPEVPAALAAGGPVEASAEVAAAGSGLSLRALRLTAAGAQVTGNARYAPASADGAGRLDAQIRARGLDLAALPPLDGALGALRGHAFGLTLDARDVRVGTGPGRGSIAASLRSDGDGLVIDSLAVADLAGASATLSGRIDPDGGGRIDGRLSARDAAPVLGLLDRVWTEAGRLVPGFLRSGPLDLALGIEREAGSADGLRTRAKGTAGGGSLDLAVTTRGGAVERGEARLAASETGRWFGRPDLPGLRRPADLLVGATRAAGGLALQASGTVAGARLTTLKPVLLPEADGPPAEGALRVEAADLGPFLALAGAVGLGPDPWPADVTLRLSGPGIADATGRIAGAALSGRLTRGPDGALGGSAALGRLSLPALAAALTIPPRAGSDPAAAGFGPPTDRPPVALDLRVDSLDLGRGLVATGAALTLGLEGGDLSVRNLSGRLAEGALAGSLVLSRRGPAATVSGEGTLADASLAALGGGPLTGRVSGQMRFAASGESLPALAAGLSGSGRLTLDALAVPAADPDALARAIPRALEADDPLREGRLDALVAEELSRAAAGTRGPVSSPATIAGGVLRAGPLALDLGPARWTGTLAYDLARARLDARGALVGGRVPRVWTGGPPTILLSLTGPMQAPERGLDTGPLAGALTGVLLQRELDKVELLEADAIERQRRRARIEMDRARAAALKAAADRAAEEAARQARLLRAQQAAAEEAARQARGREGEPRREESPPEPAEAPLDIRPPQARP